MADFDLIVFDLDGVLVDSEHLSCGCLRAMLAEQGIDIALSEVHRRFLGRGFNAVKEEYRGWRGSEIPLDFQARFDIAVRDAFAASLRPMAGISALLESLHMPYCLASSSGLERITHSLAVAHLTAFFDGRVFGAEMVKRSKPAPDLFLHAAAGMGAEPTRCLVIEDSIPGIEAARAAGMTAWGFTGGSHLREGDAASSLTASGAAAVFAKMSDLQAALAAHGV